METQRTPEQKVSREPRALVLGDVGLIIGTILGVGYSLLSNDADSGNYVVDVAENFVNHGLWVVAGATAFGYSLGRVIDRFQR